MFKHYIILLNKLREKLSGDNVTNYENYDLDLVLELKQLEKLILKLEYKNNFTKKEVLQNISLLNSLKESHSEYEDTLDYFIIFLRNKLS